MTPFSLKIVTPDGLIYDGQAEELVVRTTSGDIGILAGHINCVAPLGMGRATILIEGKKRYAACIGGILSVVNGEVRLVPTTFEWADQIDVDRAQASLDLAKSELAKPNLDAAAKKVFQARQNRAMVRLNVARKAK